ncbi:ATP-binding protein [Motilimonas sp. KMU-193]|uniref:PAS domain-containing sensor histidine kinase n=1 Tax=Motilimonas sp. KMU-193 TaxID=3388668 RepID=UPI00396AFF41
MVTENVSFDLLEQHYSKTTDGMIICDRSNKVLKANQAMCNMFGYSAERIAQMSFEDLINVDVDDVPAAYRQARNKDNITFLVVLERYVHAKSDCVLYVIRDESHSVAATKSVFGSEQSSARFKELLKNLHKISVELSNCPDMDTLYRRSVELSLEKLEIERLGLLLLQGSNQVGTFGTDEFGNVVDERGFTKPLSHSPIVLEAITRRDYVTVFQDQDLVHYNKVVGKGWQAMVMLWDKEKPIGFIAADNLLHHRALTPHMREIFGLLGSMLSHVIIKKRAEFKLKKMNEELELIVKKRTLELEQKIKQLVDTQEKLVEAEKIASLGGLVSGVAHEINTPLGISITASSLLAEMSQQLSEMVATGAIKKSALQHVADTSSESVELIQSNLERAANLVKSFKALAVDQISDSLAVLFPHEVVKNILLSYHHEMKNKPLTVYNDIAQDLTVRSFSGALVQVIVNLLLNSLQHGFIDDQTMEIRISAQAHEQGILLNYKDSGKGVSSDELKHIFEPFFTKARQNGAGLGLNQVYNLVSQKMSGQIIASLPGEGGLEFDIYLPNL